MLLLLTLLAEAACPDPLQAIDEAEAAFAEARLEAARGHLDEALDSLDCAPMPLGPLVDLLHVQGAIMLYAGEADGAALALAAARRLDPESAPELGSRVDAAWEAAEPELSPPGTVNIVEPYTTWTLTADGEPTASPVSLAPGVHLLQVLDSDGEVQWGTLVNVRSGRSQDLRTHAPEVVLPVAEVSAAPPVVVPTQPSKGAQRVLRYGGLGLAALGGVGMGLSASQGARIDTADDLTTLRALRDRQVGYGSAGLALLGVGALGFGVSFAL